MEKVVSLNVCKSCLYSHNVFHYAMTASLKNYFNYLKMNRTKSEYGNINLVSDCTLIALANERGVR